LFSSEDFELAERTMKRAHRGRTVRYDPRSPGAFFWCRLFKRLDRFELLTFQSDKRAKSLEVTTPTGAKKAGMAAWADIVSALPGGPIAAVPMRTPGLQQLIGAIVVALGRFFWAKDAKRAYDPKAAPVGYVPELRDDAGNPTIDVYFMRDWIADVYKRRVLGAFQPALGLILVVLGIFTSVYLDELLAKKLDVDIRAMIGDSSWSRQDALFWGGVVLGLVGLFLFLKPFVVMNMTTPSPLSRKWVRVRAGFREVLIAVFAMGALNQALVELWVFQRYKLPQPTPIRYVAQKFRYLQGWFMFSPNPVMDDGTLVVDAITVDGRRVDPYSIHFPPYQLAAPNFDLLHNGSFQYNQIWSDYFNRMHMGGNTSFRKPMKEFIFRLPERTGNPDDAIVKGTVYWVHDMNPRFTRIGNREHESYDYNRTELFKFSNPDAAVQERWRTLGSHEPPPAPLPVPLNEPEKDPDSSSGDDESREG
jgi:hypothetical protein